MPSNGCPQLPCLSGGRSTSSRAPQYGPKVSVIPKRFARAPGAGRCAGGSTAGRLPGPRLDRSAVAKRGCDASAAAWSGQPRNSVARSRSSSARVRSGSGAASVSSVAPATSAVSRPPASPPVQKNGIGMYRRSSAPTRRASRPDATACRALPCVWIVPFGAPRLPDVNSTTRSSAGCTRASSSRTSASSTAASGSSSASHTSRSDGRFGWRRPARVNVAMPGATASRSSR